jgi:hypothetical protein
MKQDSASRLLVAEISTSDFCEKLCATIVEMIQQKAAFLIVRESVRLVFHAKPSMRAIVVQLLVDLLRQLRQPETDLRSLTLKKLW